MRYVGHQTSPESASRQHLCASLRALVLLLLLGACGRTPTFGEQLEQRYEGWIGRSITDFMTVTGKAPFHVFTNEHGQRVYMFTPLPNGEACNLVKTAPDGAALKIVEIRAACL